MLLKQNKKLFSSATATPMPHCYKLKPGEDHLSIEPLPKFAAEDPKQSFSDIELATLNHSGVSGSLQYSDGSVGFGGNALLARPPDPLVHVRIVLDHAPIGNVLLPIPAHRDVTYVQRGEEFLALPSTGPNLPRFMWLSSSKSGASEVSILIMVQSIDGSYFGSACVDFDE